MMKVIKAFLIDIYCRIKWAYLSIRRKNIEKRLNDELLVKGAIRIADAEYIIPENWEIVNKPVEITSWDYGYLRRQYPLKVVPKKRRTK